MGININVYTIWGLKHPMDTSFRKEWGDIEEHLFERYGNRDYPESFQIRAIIGDNYVVVGHVLYDSGDFRYMDNMNEYAKLDIDPKELRRLEREYKRKFAKLYPRHKYLVDQPFELFNMIHYS